MSHGLETSIAPCTQISTHLHGTFGVGLCRLAQLPCLYSTSIISLIIVATCLRLQVVAGLLAAVVEAASELVLVVVVEA